MLEMSGTGEHGSVVARRCVAILSGSTRQDHPYGSYGDLAGV